MTDARMIRTAEVQLQKLKIMNGLLQTAILNKNVHFKGWTSLMRGRLFSLRADQS